MFVYFSAFVIMLIMIVLLSKRNIKESFISQGVVVPYTVLPRQQSLVYQNIPRVIYQTYKTNTVHPNLYKNVESWINLNPTYRYEFYDDDRIRNFILKEYDEKHLERFDSIKVGASKSDYFRILVIYKYGGVYADLDNRLLKPLDTIINSEDTEILHKQLNNWYDTHVLMMSPNNELLYKCIQMINHNIDIKMKGTAIHVTGPSVLRKIIATQNYNPKKIIHQKEYIEVHNIFNSDNDYVYWKDVDYIF